MSCDGNTYTLSPTTSAEGSAENWSLTIGFCADAAADTNATTAIVRNLAFIFELILVIENCLPHLSGSVRIYGLFYIYTVFRLWFQTLLSVKVIELDLCC